MLIWIMMWGGGRREDEDLRMLVDHLTLESKGRRAWIQPGDSSSGRV